MRSERKCNYLTKLNLAQFEYRYKIKHPRIVEFKGFILEQYAIVMELMPDGTLYDYIKKCSGNWELMPWSERYSCAIDISEGMAFLHSKSLVNGKTKDEVYHQDLKTQNVLLSRESNGRLSAKVCDLGLSGKKTLEAFSKPVNVNAYPILQSYKACSTCPQKESIKE